MTSRHMRIAASLLALMAIASTPARAADAPAGEMTWALHIDGLFKEQAGELDPKKREAILRGIQQLVHDKAMVLPIWQLALLQGVGPHVAESGLGLIADYPWSAPYEDLQLKAR